MPQFPVVCVPHNQVTIGTYSPESIGQLLVSASATAVSNVGWPSGSFAICVPVEIYEPITIAKMMIVRGTATSGNLDVGVYDANGNLKVSSGSTAQSAAAIQTFDVTDTLLQPGLYYMAVAFDNTTANMLGWSVSLIDTLPFGVFTVASAFPLPSTVTFSALFGTFVPLISMTSKITI